MKKNDLIKPRAILFDWDNTLADTWPLIHESLNKTFAAMGRDQWSFDDVKNGREGIHHSLRDSFPRLFGEKWPEAREHYYKHFLENHLEKICMVPGANETLEILFKTDIYLAVVSNKTGKYLRDEVEHLGWTKYFGKVVGATDAKSDKPSVEPVLMALENSALHPHNRKREDIWFIGDSETDIECAIGSNCTAMYFGDNEFPKKYHKDKRLDYKIAHFKNHKELTNILKKII